MPLTAPLTGCTACAGRIIAATKSAARSDTRISFSFRLLLTVEQSKAGKVPAPTNQLGCCSSERALDEANCAKKAKEVAMTITGGCRCGAVRYRIEAERITAGVATANISVRVQAR